MMVCLLVLIAFLASFIGFLEFWRILKSDKADSRWPPFGNNDAIFMLDVTSCCGIYRKHCGTCFAGHSVKIHGVIVGWSGLLPTRPGRT